MKWIIICVAMLCSCSTSKRIYTEKIKTEITYVPSVQRVALPQIKEEIVLKNENIDTLINCKNLNIRVQIQDKEIKINTEMKDSVDVMTMNKIVRVESQIKEKKSRSNIGMLFFFLFLFVVVLLFRFR